VAREAGDVLIMGGDLGLVVDSLVLARKTYWVIWQNLAWAFAYNGLMIPLAVVGAVSPLVAAGAMAGSSVTVVANALRLRAYARLRTPLEATKEIPESEIEEPQPARDPTGIDEALERARSAWAADRAAREAPQGPSEVPAPATSRAKPSTGLFRDTLAHLAEAVIRRWGEQWDP
jgi:hypothetical protein